MTLLGCKGVKIDMGDGWFVRGLAESDEIGSLW